nr:immunoglobulin light chain junction region [Macaca mulatta]MOW60122.1 immunoglobulin light chain junction region [Macaca mulatta]
DYYCQSADDSYIILF